MNRRSFIKSTVGSLAACSLFGRGVHAFSLPPITGKRVICLIMRGGYDGLSLAVPYGLPNYATNRSDSGYDLLDDDLFDIGHPWALHPDLTSLHGLWMSGELAIVNRVGYPGPANLSHFVSQDIWATMRRDASTHTSGWAGRWAKEQQASWGSTGSLVVGSPLLETKPEEDTTPRALTIPSLESFTIPLNTNDEPDSAVRNRAFKASEQLNANGHPIASLARDASLSAFELVQLIADAVADQYGQYGNPNPYDSLGRPFPAKLQDIARLVAASRSTAHPGVDGNVFFAITGGFDTHTDQKARLAERWQEVDVGLAGLIADLRAMNEWSNTTLLLFTEFGRRNKENIDAGTDHGYGNCMLAMGGCVSGGHYNPLTDAHLAEANLPADHDCRHVFWEVLEDLVGVDGDVVLPRIFDEVDKTDVVRLGLTRCAIPVPV